jgi:2-polyprenyl-6-methoxyphenol hydroxylase-like FAD-dependent oxidoreductase
MTKDGGRLAGRTVATAGACNTTVGTGDTGAAGEAKAEAEAEAEAARQRLRAERGWLTAAHTVAIVGGGIGGLATALALQQAGLRARVFERDTGFEVRRQGYGLTLSTTNTALEALGLLAELRQRDVPSRAHWVFGADGEVMGYFGNELVYPPPASGDGEGEGGSTTPPPPPPHERGNLRVPRQVLRRMLLERLAPGTVEWGEQLIDFGEDGDADEGAGGSNGVTAGGGGGVTLRFRSGRVERAAVLVGADGIHSVVRRHRRHGHGQCPAEAPAYLGVLAAVGIVSLEHPLLHERGFYTLDGAMRLFTM